MQDPQIFVTRAAVEGFSSQLLRPGISPLKSGPTSVWLDRTFRKAISKHEWRNYLALFVHEHEKFLGMPVSEIRTMEDAWFAQQTPAGLHRRNEG